MTASFPFGDPPASGSAPQLVPDNQPAGASRRRLLVLLALAVVALLAGYAAYVLVLGGDEADLGAPVPTRSRPTAAAPATPGARTSNAPTAGPGNAGPGDAGPGNAGTAGQGPGRDPFRPLVVPATGAPAQPTTGSSTVR